jgi:hypothetical protein
MGRGQVVRQRILVPSCVGSNPTAPASRVFMTHARVCVFIYKITRFLLEIGYNLHCCFHNPPVITVIPTLFVYLFTW